MNPNRRDFIKLSSLGVLGAMNSLCTKSSARPNIIIFFADDLGYGDIGSYGCRDVATPYIDSIGTNGVLFTDGYVSAPQCSPSRAGLLTGRYQQRFGHEYNFVEHEPDKGLPPAERTFADYLQQAGYRTGLIGKWHQGWGEPFAPNRRGFSHFVGFRGGGHFYSGPLDGKKSWNDYNSLLMHNGQPINDAELLQKNYLTTFLGEQAIHFIKDNRKNPFCLYLAFNAPHTPLQAPGSYLERMAHIQDPERRTFVAMISAMDDAVGMVLAAVREQGLEENTLIFFLSDNGAADRPGSGKGDNGALRGAKGSLFEGGIRIPFLMQWKGHVPAGQTCRHPVISLDIAATALALANAAAPGLDGVNLVPFLTGQQSGAPHESLFWRFVNWGVRKHGERFQWAIRQGEWKLCLESDGVLRLCNLRDDPGEENNLIDRFPDKATALQQEWQNWNNHMGEPAWPEGNGIFPWKP
jgi:arylsulfatase A-like enzyme